MDSNCLSCCVETSPYLSRELSGVDERMNTPWNLKRLFFSLEGCGHCF